MKLLEIKSINKQALMEDIKANPDHGYDDETIEEIAEAVSNFNFAGPSMKVDDAIKLILSEGYGK